MEVKAEVGEHGWSGIHEGDEATIEKSTAMPDKAVQGARVSVGQNAQIKNAGTDAEVTTFFVRVGLDSHPQVPCQACLRPWPSPPPNGAIGDGAHPGRCLARAQAEGQPEPHDPDSGPVASSSPSADAGAEDGAPATTPNGKSKLVKVVFVVGKDGKAQMRAVRIGIASRTDVEILDGVGEGETIVDGPYRTLARELEDGQRSRCSPRTAKRLRAPGAESSRWR